MNNGILSQEEIDALMNGDSSSSKKEETKIENVIQEKLSPTEEDIIGEIGNISMSTAATTLSSLLNKKVLITTPRVSLESFKKIIEECKVPKVVANIDFKEGLTGQNLLMMDVTDAKIIADLMMGGDGTKVSENFTELELSAVGEAMNQMIGSASTSMATMLEKSIDILPPEVDVWDKNEEIQTDKFDLSQNIVKVSFDLTVEGLIESEIMQIFTHETVNDMISLVMKEEVKEIKTENLKSEEKNINKETN
ncbi:MAG TPA: flagellar motor switch phosphatase FliY, partial [Tissierellaceae bacterium]